MTRWTCDKCSADIILATSAKTFNVLCLEPDPTGEVKIFEGMAHLNDDADLWFGRIPGETYRQHDCTAKEN